jgi:hypothetical protein
METYNQLSHSKTGMQQHGGEPQVHAYVLVIPKMEGPVLETLQKLFAALSTQEPVVLPLPSRKAALEVVDSWLEHSAAAEYLGVGRSTLYRYSEHQEIERANSAAGSNIDCRASMNSKPAVCGRRAIRTIAAV